MSYCIPNQRQAPCQANSTTDLIKALRSYHPGGVNTVFVDGSGHYLSNNIDPAVYRNLGTRAGGEVIGEY